LICFQSLGFILSVQQERSKEVIALFKEREITAAVIGKVTELPVVILKNGTESKVLFDFTKDKITGIVYQPTEL
jgi:selenophosphate synthetase-related protein